MSNRENYIITRVAICNTMGCLELASLLFTYVLVDEDTQDDYDVRRAVCNKHLDVVRHDVLEETDLIVVEWLPPVR